MSHPRFDFGTLREPELRKRWELAMASAERQAGMTGSDGLGQRILRTMAQFNGAAGGYARGMDAVRDLLRVELAGKDLQPTVSNLLAESFALALFSGERERLASLERIQADKSAYSGGLKRANTALDAARVLGESIADEGNAAFLGHGLKRGEIAEDQAALVRNIRGSGSLGPALRALERDHLVAERQRDRILRGMSDSFTRRVLLNGSAMSMTSSVMDAVTSLMATPLKVNDRMAVSLNYGLNSVFVALAFDILDEGPKKRFAKEAAELKAMLDGGRGAADAAERLGRIKARRGLLAYHLEAECPGIEDMVASYSISEATADAVLIDREKLFRMVTGALDEFIRLVKDQARGPLVDVSGGMQSGGITITMFNIPSATIESLKEMAAVHRKVLEIAIRDRGPKA